MEKYSIKELEHLSGIKAHTLRIWELRYGILEPKRTETNIRYYNNDDLKHLLKVSLLNQNGHKISKIAKMTREEQSEMVKYLLEDITQTSAQINALTTSMIELDESRFEEVMNNNIAHNGFEATMIHLIYPFLEKIGILWLSGSINPAQEHFMTNLIRQKVIVGIDGLKTPPDPQKPHYLLFLPEGELHELSLLFSHYLLKNRQFKVTYLGSSVPLKDVIEIVKYKKIDQIFSIMTTYPNNRKLKQYIKKMGEQLSEQTICLSGYQASRIAFPIPENIKIYHRVTDLVMPKGANRESEITNQPNSSSN